jgi:hypothetical protein
MANHPGDHPAVKKIEEIVSSPEGQAAMKSASSRGQPALAGVDHLLSEALGKDYAHREVRSWAGWHVAARMRALGYKSICSRRTPPGCIARSGLYFAG